MAYNFGYTIPYIDYWLDLDDLAEHLKYMDACPPPGMILKALAQAFAGEEAEQPLQETKEPQYSDNLDDFIRDFTAAGGTMR